ncbi:Alpha/Beta hydrolase protein [Pestalotiopsis sp. NC0098]|nr:Alpha/Beta hydrolase protein [Pestalotiopsis sp. NC0098]
MCESTNSICKDQFADVVENNTTCSAFDRRLHNCNDGVTCAGEASLLTDYLNSPRVHELLELQTATGGLKSAWSLLDLATANRYIAAGDHHFPSVRELKTVLNYIPKSTERPVDVLYYVSVTDVVCNPLGVQQTLEGLRWRGSVEFHAVPWVDLPYETAAHGPGGRVKSARALTLVELEEAGHLVPLDQPAMALQMVKDWVSYLQTGVRLSSGGIKSGSHSAEARDSKGGFVVQEL